jgi:hypothetical protein
MQQQKIGQGLNAGLNPPCALRRMGGDVIKGLRRGLQAPEGCSEASQTVFSPYRPDLLIARKFATGSRSFRGRDRGLLFGRERHRRFILGTGQAKNNMGYVVLRIRRKAARGFERLIE